MYLEKWLFKSCIYFYLVTYCNSNYCVFYVLFRIQDSVCWNSKTHAATCICDFWGATQLRGFFLIEKLKYFSYNYHLGTVVAQRMNEDGMCVGSERTFICMFMQSSVTIYLQNHWSDFIAAFSNEFGFDWCIWLDRCCGKCSLRANGHTFSK